MLSGGGRGGRAHALAAGSAVGRNARARQTDALDGRVASDLWGAFGTRTRVQRCTVRLCLDQGANLGLARWARAQLGGAKACWAQELARSEPPGGRGKSLKLGRLGGRDSREVWGQSDRDE